MTETRDYIFLLCSIFVFIVAIEIGQWHFDGSDLQYWMLWGLIAAAVLLYVLAARHFGVKRKIAGAFYVGVAPITAIVFPVHSIFQLAQFLLLWLVILVPATFFLPRS